MIGGFLALQSEIEVNPEELVVYGIDPYYSLYLTARSRTKSS